MSQLLTSFQWNPCTLVFAITSLDFLMNILLYFAFKDSCAGGLVKASSLQNVGGIDPIVQSPSHDMFLEVGTKLKLIHRDSTISGTIDARPGGGSSRSTFYHNEEAGRP